MNPWKAFFAFWLCFEKWNLQMTAFACIAFDQDMKQDDPSFHNEEQICPQLDAQRMS